MALSTCWYKPNNHGLRLPRTSQTMMDSGCHVQATPKTKLSGGGRGEKRVECLLGRGRGREHGQSTARTRAGWGGGGTRLLCADGFLAGGRSGSVRLRQLSLEMRQLVSQGARLRQGGCRVARHGLRPLLDLRQPSAPPQPHLMVQLSKDTKCLRNMCQVHEDKVPLLLNPKYIKVITAGASSNTFYWKSSTVHQNRQAPLLRKNVMVEER